MKKVEVAKEKWVKPKVEVKELTMRSLLGENGWNSEYNERSILAIALTGPI